MSYDAAKLFSLLPALYRLRDADVAAGATFLGAAESAELAALQAVGNPNPQQIARLGHLLGKRDRGPLGSLLAVIAEQLLVMGENLEQLYDDQFIETCAQWVIPYIGDLIGYSPLGGNVPAVSSPRAEVGHTISFRRRKGTAAMLEQLARDVTGWGACVVEFFQRLGATQYMNHIRPQALGYADLRDWEKLIYVGHAFDRLPHTVDVRRIAIGRGRYNIPNIGVFLWRLYPYSLSNSPAVADSAHPWRFWMSPLGNDTPLFTNPLTEDSVTHLATSRDVPGPIPLRVMDAHLADYYPQSVSLVVDGAVIPLADGNGNPQIRVCNLADDSGTWNMQPTDETYVIDPTRGRFVVPSGVVQPSKVHVSFYHGFSAPMGGGEYTRATDGQPSAYVTLTPHPADPSYFTTITAALASLAGTGIVEICDNERYTEAPRVTVAANQRIEIRAASGCRPTLLLSGIMSISGSEESVCTLSGLLMTAAANVDWTNAPAQVQIPRTAADGSSNQLSQLQLADCTFVPGWTLDENSAPGEAKAPTLIADAVPGLQVRVSACITGPLYIDREAALTASDSILDATATHQVAYAGTDGRGPGGTLTLNAVTVIGKVHANIIGVVSDSVLMAELASTDIWPAAVWVERRQQGCVRFTYLPTDSIVPSRFECQPPLPGETPASVCAAATAGMPVAVGPRFATLRYGVPAYCQMRPTTSDAIRRGADDEGEMGAFHGLYQPQRETNLSTRLAEYLRIGLQAGMFYET
jgi:hypothetical protein